jgi:Xaa-Pro dipeptidase
MGSDLMKLLAERSWPETEVDEVRMRGHRHDALQDAMARHGVDVALLLHGAHVGYATGQPVRGVDVTHAVFERPVAIVVAGEERPHLLADGDQPTSAPDVARHPGVWPELDEGVEALRGTLAEVAGPLAGRRVAVDAVTGPMARAGLLDGATPVDAAPVVAEAKLRKSADEIGCIARAQRLNEQAMVAAQEALRPGATRAEVAGVFLAGLTGLGVAANLIDPIFERMPRRRALGPRTTTGDVAFPTGIGDETYAEGDLIWVDSGIDHRGYASDFGRTWIVGRDPDAAEQAVFERWCEVMVAVLGVLGPGVTGAELCRAAERANGGAAPWLPHFYLAHGVGVESAEMPLVGTDLGPDFDARLVLEPGTVLVLEPVVWEDGVGGHRAEEIVTVTDDGWRHLGGGHPYEPFAA